MNDEDYDALNYLEGRCLGDVEDDGDYDECSHCQYADDCANGIGEHWLDC